MSAPAVVCSKQNKDLLTLKVRNLVHLLLGRSPKVTLAYRLGRDLASLAPPSVEIRELGSLQEQFQSEIRPTEVVRSYHVRVQPLDRYGCSHAYCELCGGSSTCVHVKVIALSALTHTVGRLGLFQSWMTSSEEEMLEEFEHLSEAMQSGYGEPS